MQTDYIEIGLISVISYGDNKSASPIY